MPEHLAGRGAGPAAVRDRSRSPARRQQQQQQQDKTPCWYWNNKQGRCGGRTGPCEHGLTHGVCDVCFRVGHRSCDAHGGKGKAKGKGKGGKNKGKGKKGDKGKNEDKEAR